MQSRQTRRRRWLNFPYGMPLNRNLQAEFQFRSTQQSESCYSTLGEWGDAMKEDDFVGELLKDSKKEGIERKWQMFGFS